MAYIPTHSAGTVAGLPADIIGTGGVALKGMIPLAVGAGVGLGLYSMFKKRQKQIKKFNKSYKRSKSTKKPWGFYI